MGCPRPRGRDGAVITFHRNGRVLMAITALHRADLIDQGERGSYSATRLGMPLAQPVLRSKAEVEADEGQCAMQTPEVLIEEASHRVPVVMEAKITNTDHKDDVVEMSNDEVGVVDVMSNGTWARATPVIPPSTKFTMKPQEKSMALLG